MFKAACNDFKAGRRPDEGFSSLLNPTEADLEEVFRKWDADGSEGIDKNELRTALAELALGHSKEEVDEIFLESDLNDDKKIDFEEFRRVVRTPCSVEKWANGLPFARLFALFLPRVESPRDPKKQDPDEHNPLKALTHLAAQKDARQKLDQIIDELLPYLKELAYERLVALGKTARKVRETVPTGGSSKFASFQVN
jgi:hypothetical protein